MFLMEILNLIQCTGLGGMEQASLRLMLAMKAREHQFKVLSLNPLGALTPLLNQAGITAEGLPYRGRGGWRSWLALRQKLARSGAEALLMTGNHLVSMLALGGACKHHRVLAVHFHHTGVKPSWQWRLIYSLACHKFRAITFPSDFIRKEAESLYPAVRRIAHTVRNPLAVPPESTTEQRHEARVRLGLPQDVPIIGNAGWLIQRKRFDVFLRVAARVLLTRNDAIFVIAGDGPERHSLERLAHELHIEHSIRWLGWQQNLEVFYRAIDVLLFNSDWDALPTTPQEAMSYGIPVVASAEHGGLAEVIDSPECGHVINRHDTSALAQEIIALLDSREKRNVLGRAGRERIFRLGDPAMIAAAYENLFLN